MEPDSAGNLPSPTAALFDENGMPIFDKTRLLSTEFEPYRYTLEFKTTDVVDMTVGGYQRAIRPYQDGGYVAEHIATHIMGSTIYCQVKVCIRLLSGVVFESFGDSDNRGVPDGDTCLRTAESLAFKRAVQRALDISSVDFGNAKKPPKRASSKSGRGSYAGANERLAARGTDLSTNMPPAVPPKPPAELSDTAKGVWGRLGA
jgi:hypothetical protein